MDLLSFSFNILKRVSLPMWCPVLLVCRNSVVPVLKSIPCVRLSPLARFYISTLLRRFAANSLIRSHVPIPLTDPVQHGPTEFMKLFKPQSVLPTLQMSNEGWKVAIIGDQGVGKTVIAVMVSILCHRSAAHSPKYTQDRFVEVRRCPTYYRRRKTFVSVI